MHASMTAASRLREALDKFNHEGSDSFLDEYCAAEFLGMSVRTLRNHRFRGGGAPFKKLGAAVRYSLKDLKDWVAPTYRATCEVMQDRVRPIESSSQN